MQKETTWQKGKKVDAAKRGEVKSLGKKNLKKPVKWSHPGSRTYSRRSEIVIKAS